MIIGENMHIINKSLTNHNGVRYGKCPSLMPQNALINSDISDNLHKSPP